VQHYLPHLQTLLRPSLQESFDAAHKALDCIGIGDFRCGWVQ
jgi:hypothetical protein